MVWYRDTPPSLEQAEGMPKPMTNYFFDDGGTIMIGVRKRSSIPRSLLFSSWSISTSILRTRYWSQNSSVTRRASSTAGKELRSGTGGIGPCILWEKARPTLIAPTEVGFLFLELLAICSSLLDDIFFTSSLTLWSMSLRLDAILSSSTHPTKVPWSRSRRSSRRRFSS